MKHFNDLTILLTLKGRHLHTLRWLWHANRIYFPFHVLIADGEVHPTIARLLSDPKTFQNLSIEYHRYDDKSISDFCIKCADALGKVRTPYVVMADNDDFLFPSGILKSIAFLDGAPDYVSAGGGIPGFSIDSYSNSTQNVTGSLRRIKYRCFSDGSCNWRDFDDPLVVNRILEEITNFLVIYYNVYRTQALHKIHKEIVRYDFTSRFFELYSALRTVTIGKVKSDPSFFSFLRQEGTSQSLSSDLDWVDRLLFKNFSQNLESMASKISYEAAKADGCDQAEVRVRILKSFAAVLRVTLANTMLRYRFPRLFALKRYYLSLPRPRLMPALAQRKLDGHRLWKNLSSDGADSDTISAHKLELEEIAVTLQGDAFIDFVSRHAPDLLSLPPEKSSYL